MKPVKFTRRAETRLTEIARWTIDNFGPGQASDYEAVLLSAVEGLSEGELAGRDCALLAPDLSSEETLRYVRAGRHYLIYVETPDAIAVIEIIHGSMDLEAILKELAERRR